MITENPLLMLKARESLKNKWGLAIATCLIYMIILGVPGILKITGSIISLIIGGPMFLGLSIFSLAVARNRDADIGQLFLGFNQFTLSLGAYILIVVFTVLWSLLLIVPGIIAAISYSMTFYIIADGGSLDAMDAINKSKKMMFGFKWKYFCLWLRFIGWAIICVLTLGIGFLWLVPYIQISLAKFYDDLKANQIVQANPEPSANL